MGLFWLAIFGSIGVINTTLAEENSCKVTKGTLSSLPMPCEGTVIILRNPEYCGSCAIKEQSMSKAPKALNDFTDFLKDELIWVGGSAEKSEGLKVKGATCLGETGEKLSYIEYVRRRELCRAEAESRHVASGVRFELKGTEAAWVKKSAVTLAARDREQIKVIGSDELLRKMNERAEKFKLDHQCLMGVRATMKERPVWAVDPFVSPASGKLSKEEAGKELVALNKLSTLIKSGTKLSEITKDYSRYFDPGTAAIVKARVDETAQKFEAVNRNLGSFCGEPYAQISTAQAVERDIELTIPVTAYFANSTSVLDTKKADAMKAEIQSQILKNSEIARCGGGITGVDVYASANKLANGDPYGKWDFKELSGDRAAFVRDQVLGTMTDPLMKDFNFKEKANVILGDQNSGAAGACPYKLSLSEDGPQTVSLDSKYTQRGTKEQLEMEAAKVVKVALRFKSKCHSTVTGSRPNLQIHAGGCVQPEFSCIGR